ncbi:MAG: DUF1499 domain-containing protein [Erythrobacter sp.]
MDKKKLLTRIAVSLAIFLPFYFAIAALGTKFGLWDYKFSLGTLIRETAPILLGLTALIALIALIMTLWKAPRTGWIKPLFALAVPVGIFAFLGSVGSTAGENPIHDVATDTANPPAFSAATMAERTEGESNPLSDYSTPLGQTEFWKAANVQEPLASQSTAAIIAERYPDLGPILINAGDETLALETAKTSMKELGYSDVLDDPANGTVEGVDETFWFGFKDDVVVRIANGRVDFRSVSRVGQSDLGANAKRIAELREAVEMELISP